MMRVLSVLHYPIYGGPHNRNAQVSVILRAKGVESILLLPEEAVDAAARVEAAGAKTLRMPLARLRKTLRPSEHLRFVSSFFQNVREIQSVIRKYRIDVVVVNGLMNPHAVVAAKRETVPVVWQLLDSFPPSFVRRIMRPLVNRYANVVMCTGFNVATQHLGTLRTIKPLILFYPPVDLRRFDPQLSIRQLAREELGFDQGNLVIGNIANVNPMKNHMTFIRAAVLVKHAFPQARFVIFGQTYENHQQYAKRLFAEATNLGLNIGKDLQIVDPGMRVAELAQALDIYWLTSKPRSEGISTAAEEAMALGLPVISTETGSMSEIVQHGKTGFMVPPYDVDAISRYTLRLADDAVLRQKLGNAARQFSLDHFGAERCAMLHLVAYRAALGDKQALHCLQTL